NQPNDATKMIGLVAEHIVAFSKNKAVLKQSGVGKVPLTGSFTNPDNDPRGDWASKPWKVGSDQSGSRYVIENPSGELLDEEWMGDKNTFDALLADNRIIWAKKGSGTPRKKYFKFEREAEGQCATNWWTHEVFGHNQGANDAMTNLMGIKNVFSNPKSLELLSGLISISNAKSNDIILDFFSGSATTAHAVMQLNAEDGGKRKFIMVQIPEACDEKSEAFKAGYKTIADIGKERIRRAGQKIKTDNALTATDLDIGFRVLKIDSSNMKDVYYTPDNLNQNDLFNLVDNVREDRSAEDLLFQVLLDWGVDLTLPITQETIADFKVLFVDDNALAACFDADINEAFVKELAARHPMRVVFRDTCFANDSIKINIEQIFKLISPATEIKTL
ncbi:MAG: site-specific DNA-methyltransferase, partial [Methylovulum sp.]